MQLPSSDQSDFQQPLLRKHGGNGSAYSQLDEGYGTQRKDHPDDAHKENGHLLKDTLYPSDAYKGRTYWADLPVKEQVKWTGHQYHTEAGREAGVVWQLFKENPLKPLITYMKNYAVSGIGFFAEGYVLFSVGNIMPLFKSLYPECWADHIVCDNEMIKAIKYMEILGIICGQLLVGYIGDVLGRRWGLIQDAIIMLLGTIMLTSMWGQTLNGWTVIYGVSIFIFSLGVGGEFPMTSTTSMEKYHGKADRMHRGRSVCLAFLMQGWGQLANQLALLALLYAFSGSLEPPYSSFVTQATFRISFVLAGLSLVYFLYLRVYKLKNVDAKDSDQTAGYDLNTLKLFVRHYWHRMFATSLCWFCSDFAFYGMQIFRNQLLQLVTGTEPDEVGILWLYNLINIAVQLVGYYLAAMLIDHKAYGRKVMQLVGFGMIFALLIIAAGAFPILNQKGLGAKVFQAIYFFANFWVQFGPNSTTFLIAGEVFPKSVRATAHGFSAATGKSGALAATVLFNYIEDRSKFWLAALCTFVGFVLTMAFVPDTTGLDLPEQQRYWSRVVEGRQNNYHGVAIHPEHLSWYERAVLGRAENYDSEKDRMERIAELREEYEKSGNGDERGEQEAPIGTEVDPDGNVKKYFELERAKEGSQEGSSDEPDGVQVDLPHSRIRG
ncbi:hypothetical protein OHC33_011153 [Knufia fluminis]|uniref:Major facilitator superfamily (MFS) profile domain-containing protein n=1 Tax=Knufia fluminis TaxID=191047 RepID=A0AAN8IH84_9EURO|nr:hypothetical protein OHC33_011153 [Knufia fluminis]